MASSSHLLLFKPPPSSSSSSPIIICLTLHLHKSLQTTLFPSPPPRPRFFCNFSSSSSCASSTSLPFPHILSRSLILKQDKDSQDEFPQQEEDEGGEGEGESEIRIKSPLPPPSMVNKSALMVPTLTVKERKELLVYAHSLGKKLKIQQVGKSGVTDSSAAAFVENLESNELLKLKIHNSCPGELPDVIKQLEATTGSVAIGQIGRSVILYRPSLTKLKAEEKKRQAQRVIARRGFRPRPTEFRMKPAEFRSKPDESTEKRGQAPISSGRGRRGTSRVELP